MSDYLDKKNGVLYCSRECAIADGADPDDVEPLDPNDYSTEEYGALCKNEDCEKPYHNF